MSKSALILYWEVRESQPLIPGMSVIVKQHGYLAGHIEHPPYTGVRPGDEDEIVEKIRAGQGAVTSAQALEKLPVRKHAEEKIDVQLVNQLRYLPSVGIA